MKNFLQRNFYMLIAMYAFTIYMSNDAFLPAMSQIASDMKVSEGSIELAVTNFVIGSLVLQLFMGPLSDKYGRKTTIIICGVIFLVSNMYCGYTNNINGLLFARLWSGSSMAAIAASGFSAITEYYDEKKSVKALSYSANLTILAPLLGPIIGAYILKYTHSWRNIFYYDTALMFVVLVLIVICMPETNQDVVMRKAQKKGDLQESNNGNGNPRSHKGISLTEKFRGMIMLSKNKTFVAYSICGALASFSFMMWITGSPVLLVDNLGQTRTEYSLWQIPVFVGMIIGNNVAIYMSHTMGVDKTVNRTLLIVPICAVIFMGGTYFFHTSPLGIVIPMSIFLFTRGLQNAPMSQFLLTMGGNFKGSAGALSGLIATVGSVLGSYVSSRMAESSNFATISVMSVGIILILIVGFFARLWHKQDLAKAQ